MKSGLLGVVVLVVAWLIIASSEAGVHFDEVFLRGDVNGDGTIDVSDPTALQSYLFMGSYTPSCIEACDANADGSVNNTDSIYELNYLFAGGPAPSGVVACY